MSQEHVARRRPGGGELGQPRPHPRLAARPARRGRRHLRRRAGARAGVRDAVRHPRGDGRLAGGRDPPRYRRHRRRARRRTPTSSWPGRRSRPASTCCARSRWPTTSATRGGPRELARRKGPQDQARLHLPLQPGRAVRQVADRRGLRRHAVHLQRLRAELAVARPAGRRCARSITTPTSRSSRSRRSKATARRSSTSATGGWAPTTRGWSARCATSSPSAWCAPPAG